MNNYYYVDFSGELKDDQKIQNRFVRHYNKWCNTINQYQEELNRMFDEQWKGKPIQDYSKCEEYEEWMLKQYRYILKKSGLKRDLILDYEIDYELQLIGFKRHGKRKGQWISFVLRKG